MVEIDNNKSLLLPNTTVTEAVDLLAALYTDALVSGRPLRAIPTPFFWGPAGVGKSEGVNQLAEKLRRSTGKKVTVTDVRLLLFSPVDLRGVPVADARRQYTDWLRPRIFAMDESEDTVNILFLDELSAAPQSVQAAAYQICLDRRVGEHTLPENCVVIAAGNRTTDRSISYKMPKALCNRLMHFNIVTGFESWRSWAEANGMDSRVVGYLSDHRDRLLVEPGNSDMAYPTPRSWSFVSNLLAITGKKPTAIRPLISGCVGADTAAELEEWCLVSSCLPSPESILGGKCTDYPSRQDLIYSLLNSLLSVIRSRGSGITERELENACAYVSRFPADFAMMFFKDLHGVEGLKLRLMKCRSMQEWVSRNRKLL